MLRPSPNHGILRLPNDDDDDVTLRQHTPLGQSVMYRTTINHYVFVSALDNVRNRHIRVTKRVMQASKKIMERRLHWYGK